MLAVDWNLNFILQDFLCVYVLCFGGYLKKNASSNFASSREIHDNPVGHYGWECDMKEAVSSNWLRFIVKYFEVSKRRVIEAASLYKYRD